MPSPIAILAAAGTEGSPASCFTRRFRDLPPQGASNPRLNEGLTALGVALRDDVDRAPASGGSLPTFAGYTYLGQFIDHDLTFDLTSLKDAQPDETKTPNFRTPLLDLDHVYGGGPNLAPFLYQNKMENRTAERFLIGRTKQAGVEAGTDCDLPRNPEGLGLTGDPRQDENLIIGQLHVVFLKLHNWILDHPDELKKWPMYERAGSRFAAAQRVLRWHYQWIIRHDFLKRILDSTVFSELSELETNPPTQPAGDFQIPLEFSVAAYRFGHSMVRNHYVINMHQSRADLGQLIRLTGPGGLVTAQPPLQLPQDWVVDWRFFFPVDAPGTAQRAAIIDSRMSGAFYDVPLKVQKLFSIPVPVSEEELRLPIRTLLRGAKVALPSGQKVAEKLGCEVLKGARLTAGTRPDEEAALNQYGFLEDTPLWYYILREAEILGKDFKLGPTGSKLIAEVFAGAFRATPDCYLSVSPNWVPTLPMSEMKDDPRDFDMSDLLRTVI